MGDFDQRHQQVTNQTNIAGDQYSAGRDFHQVAGDQGVSSMAIAELNSLLQMVQEISSHSGLDQDILLDVEFSLKKASSELEKAEPKRAALLEYLDSSKKILDKAAGASKSATTLATAIGAAYAKFQGWF